MIAALVLIGILVVAGLWMYGVLDDEVGVFLFAAAVFTVFTVATTSC